MSNMISEKNSFETNGFASSKHKYVCTVLISYDSSVPEKLANYQQGNIRNCHYLSFYAFGCFMKKRQQRIQ